MRWPNKSYGDVPDPVHKSHLNELTGEYGCPRRFKYQRDAEHAGDATEPRATVNAHLVCGTAAHETIARALNAPRSRDHLLRVPGAHMPELDSAGKLAARVRKTFEHELGVAADGRAIDWPGDEKADDMVTDRVAMCTGVLDSLHRYARRVVAVEPGFIVELEGVWYSGHVDLIFEPADVPPDPATGVTAVGICDWKSGKAKPDPLELAHGWEAGIYALACERGVFLPREVVQCERDADGAWRGWVAFPCAGAADVVVEVTRPTRWQAERDALERALQSIASGAVAWHPLAFTLGAYPSRVYHVHMRDYVPYEKSGHKAAKRPEDVAFYGLASEGRVKYAAGDLRGPAWIPVDLQPTAVSRLAYRARTVIGTVRMGRFFDLVGEKCRRCPYAKDCLTTGYAPRGDELATLKATLKEAGLA